MSEEIVEVERNGEIFELRVPTGTPDNEIEAFLSSQETNSQETTSVKKPGLPPPGSDEYNRLKAKLEAGTGLKEFGETFAEPFNRGVASTVEFPVTLLNAGIAGLFAADKWVSKNLFGTTDARSDNVPQLGKPITKLGEMAGMIAPEGEQKEGLIPRAMELTGASVLPLGALLQYGKGALASLSPVPSTLQQMGRATAANPGSSTAWTIASNFTASAGGSIAKNFTDNETIIAMSELGAGFVPSALALVPILFSKLTLSGKIADKLLETLAPFTEKGARVAASARLQDVAGDPAAAAAKIDPTSTLPPALQTNDPGLIQLQNMVLKRFPALHKKYTEELRLSIEALVKNADFGGDVQRARHILNVRGQVAVEEAHAALSKLKPDASPRVISSTVRKVVQKALDDSVLIENRLWENLKSDAPGNLTNTKEMYANQISVLSPDDDLDYLPKWLVARLKEDTLSPEVMSQLDRAGWVSADGKISPALKGILESEFPVRQRTFNDLQVIRSRLLKDMRNEKGRTDRPPDRNKLRLMGEIQSALLEDMKATGIAGIDDAIAFSSAVNTRYRSGRIGRLLGFDKTGLERVDGTDLLQEVVYGQHSATNTQRLTEMANEAPQKTIDFIKARYIESVYDGNITNPKAHKQFIKNLRKSGLLEVFPELEIELNAAHNAGLDALKLHVPENQVNTTTINKNQSRAALLLQANPARQMKLVLNSNNPHASAREIMKIISGDKSAVQGVKSSLMEEFMIRAGGNDLDANGRIIPDGIALKKLLDDYETLMRDFHMTDLEINRAKRTAEQISLGQTKGGDIMIGTTIMDGGLAKPIDLLARYAGARTGGRLGDSSGASIQLANIFSREGRERILNLTTSKAEELVIQAQFDPELYKSLLIGPRSTADAKNKAEKIILRAIMQSELTGVRVLAVGSTQDETITDE